MHRLRHLLAQSGFRQQLVLAFSIGIACLAIVSSVAISSMTSDTLRGQLLGHGRQVTETVAAQSGLALLYGSEQGARDVVQATLEFPDINGVAIFDASREVLYAEGAGALLPNADGALPRAALEGLELEDIWYFVAPVYSEVGESENSSPFVALPGDRVLLGYVGVAMGKQTLNAMGADILGTNLVVSGSLAALILLVLLAITRRLTNPVKHLASIMSRAAGGERRLRADFRGSKEVLDMEKAFNTMMRTLEGREKELIAARDLALESARAKGEFAANVSHELRTPLNGVLGMLELLNGMGLTPKQREYVEVACGSGEALLGLIDDILDFSKIDAGKLEVRTEVFDLHQLLDDVVGLLAGQAQRKDLDLAYSLGSEIPSVVRGDLGRIRQVLINLVGNAVKFTELGEVAIWVRLLGEERDQCRIQFEVEDSGVGIAPEITERIFEPFSQADGSTTRRFGGTGLGLAISRQLVELMGGDIGAESKLGNGSKFWFTLPVARVDQDRSKLPGRTDAIAGLRVLAIDDSPANLRFLEQSFSAWSCSFSGVSDVDQGLDMARAASNRGRPFDILLLDEGLPRLAGGNLVHVFGDATGLSGARVLLLSNQWRPRGARCLQQGAARTLAKPLRRAPLYDALQAVIKGTSEERAPRKDDRGDETLSYVGRQVLVVEDNRANQKVAEGMLERLGCFVHVVSDGKQALEAVARRSCDLVLMDCQMPLMDGFEATRRIRSLESVGSHLPIIAMTAHVQEKNSADCIAAGMDDYLAKPLKLSALRAKLAQWIDATEFTATVDDKVNDGAQRSETGKMSEPLDQGVLGDLRESLGDAVSQVIEFYLEDTPGLLSELENAVRQSDNETLTQRAHNIKGSSRNIGAHRLANLCKAMEDCGQRDIDQGAEPLLRRLSAEFERVKAALQHEIKTPCSREGKGDKIDARILVVDDDRGMRVALRNILEQTGYRIQEAANGEMALALCERKIPDLVLMDAMMPIVDGFEACTRIRQLPGAAQLPVLIVTALDDEKSIERAFSAGATDYIPKPVHFSVLRQRVGRLLEAGRAERHVHHLAYHDALTGLPNRAFVTEHLGELLAKSRPNGEMVAVLFLDLDRFKLVNDTLGHDVGDMLLQAVSERIKGGVRSGDMVARLGGDEFVVVLDGVRAADVAAGVAEKIWHVLSEPFVFMGQEMYVTTSIGIALNPQDGDDISTLMKRADTAMFRAKESRIHFHFYEQNMEVEISNRLALESELRRALERQELILHYQPQTELESGELVGMEALVRWQHPERGLLPPAEFITLAEETGLIDKLGEWVMREACSQVTRWRQQGHGAIRVAVNLSSRQLGQDDLPETVAGVLSETGVPPQCLELEITESSIMNRADGGISVLRGLRELGVTLAIDDFGTGYSSLSSLKRFPVDMLKIDRSFVRDSVSNTDDAAIITGIVALAQSLRLKVMAEGVETGDQQSFLRGLGCDFMQGFVLSEPVCANTFETRFLKDRQRMVDSARDVIRLDEHRGVKH